MADKLNKGDIITITSGEYSDYTLHGVFRVVESFNPDEVLEDYLRRNLVQRRDYEFDRSGFLAYMHAANLLHQLDHGNIHTDDYSCAAKELDWSAPSGGDPETDA